MQVEKANAPAHLVDDGVDVWFCSDRCRERYERSRPEVAPDRSTE
jgi:YHS domain-containing protein